MHTKPLSPVHAASAVQVEAPITIVQATTVFGALRGLETFSQLLQRTVVREDDAEHDAEEPAAADCGQSDSAVPAPLRWALSWLQSWQDPLVPEGAHSEGRHPSCRYNLLQTARCTSCQDDWIQHPAEGCQGAPGCTVRFSGPQCKQTLGVSVVVGECLPHWALHKMESSALHCRSTCPHTCQACGLHEGPMLACRLHVVRH